MNEAMKEPDGMQSSPLVTEIPALLVAGGSCSHLCRMPRSAMLAASPVDATSGTSATRRRGARIKENTR